MSGPTPLYIAVAGRWSEDSPRILALCESVGEEIAKRHHIVLCGGGPGAMLAVCIGAKRFAGTTVGLLAGHERSKANAFVDVALPTGIGYELRSALIIRACDALIVVGGGNGSLGEVSCAYLHGRPIIALTGSGGVADRLPTMTHEGRYLDERERVSIVFAASPAECVTQAETAVWQDCK